MKENILYLECSAGISGDMAVAALLDLGADRQVLMKSLNSLPLSDYSIEIKYVFKSGIRACDFNVILEHDNHDHDMKYLHNHVSSVPTANDSGIPSHCATGHDDNNSIHRHKHIPEQAQAHGQQHTSEHSQAHGHQHHHDARNLNDIIQIIQSGDLTDGARQLAIDIFRIIAEAEANVHGKKVEEVHFHEVGAVDSIVDIVAFAVCFDNLHPDRVIVSPLTDGTGQIRCQHGIIPVPVPAVTAIIQHHGVPLKISSVEGELVTPTGAAIAAALYNGEKLPAEFRIEKIGFGAGKRDYATAGFLRAMLLEAESDDTHDTILTLETNIDDCTGEALSYTMQQLLDAGALDVFFIPICMKKNRPAQLLKVICKPESRKTMESIIFRNTTTIGIRFQELNRTKLERKIIALETPWGMADVKCCYYGDETYYYPENDSVCRLAQKNKMGFSEMYNLIQMYAREHAAYF